MNLNTWYRVNKLEVSLRTCAYGNKIDQNNRPCQQHVTGNIVTYFLLKKT